MAQLVQDVGQLQPDHDEDETVEEEGDHLPKGLRLQPGARGERGRMPAQVHARRDHREHAGDLEPLGQKISGERREKRDRDLHRWIVETPLHPPHDQTDEQAKADPAKTDQKKTQTGSA